MERGTMRKQTKKDRDYKLKSTRGPVRYDHEPTRRRLNELTMQWNRFQDHYGELLHQGDLK